MENPNPKTQQQSPLAQSKPKRKHGRVASMADLVEDPARLKWSLQRFWVRVQRGGENECWPWLRSVTDGYGVFGLGNRVMLVHRLSYLIAHGTIDPDLFVMHTCDNRKCVNPAHLKQGSVVDNNRDAYLKGRIPMGEHASGAKLTTAEVLEIRRRLVTGYRIGAALAREYNVSKGAIYHIRNGKRWKCLS